MPEKKAKKSGGSVKSPTPKTQPSPGSEKQDKTDKSASKEARKDIGSRSSVQGYAFISDLSEKDQNLFLAISFGKIHRVAANLDSVENMDMRNNEMQTLLIHAMHSATGPLSLQLVRLLLNAGCDVNAQDIYGRTALMYACADIESSDSVRALIRQNKIDPNLVDCEGNTALMFAVAADSVQAVDVLLKHRKIRHKVNVNIANSISLTALDMAVSLKSVECCNIIVQTSGSKITRIADEEGLKALIGVGKLTTESKC